MILQDNKYKYNTIKIYIIFDTYKIKELIYTN